MTLRVVCHDNTCDTISFFILQLGIDCKKIKMFHRNFDRTWVTVGTDPIRMPTHIAAPDESSERRAFHTTKNEMPLSTWRIEE